MNRPRIAVIGAGAWGTALALLAHRAGHAVTLWARDPARAAAIAATRHNPRLPGAALPADLALCSNALPDGADAVLLVVPVAHLRKIAAALPPGDAPLIACCKGMEGESLALPLEVLAALHPARARAMLSGPNFAAEIAAGKPAAAVIASADAPLRQRLAILLAAPGFRVYGNDDPQGVQLCAAAKNVIAIAAGAVIGAGLGENARAALITRALAELARLIVACGGRAETVAGLSGLGDLLLTATGPASRNFSAGLALGRGEAPHDPARGVAEGLAAAPALAAYAARHAVEMPVIDAVAALIAGRIGLAAAMAALLSRPQRDE
ncbi:MAG: NAD(P)H-dependent glycerol-3-phosphate dehydrogenase [Rhodospirillales bacterium]|nr:NAD(P)H-dependent glycerol-3-phosphate dehydrogenase [Rhodospirillales bacterium]